MGKATIEFVDIENGQVDVRLRIEGAQKPEDNEGLFNEESGAHKMAAETNGYLFRKYNGETTDDLSIEDLLEQIGQAMKGGKQDEA